MIGEFIRECPLMLLDTNNTPLGIGGTIPAAIVHKTISGFFEIVGVCRTDQNGTLYVDQFTLPSQLPYTTTLAVLAGVTLAFAIKVIAPFYQFRYLNGAIAQAIFQLNIYGKTIG